MKRTKNLDVSQWILATALMAICLAIAFQNTGCRHEPFLVDPVDPMDTIPTDTTQYIPCEDGIVYFEYDVLPILISNCSVPGCHDPASAQKDVVLTSYDAVIASKVVRPFRLDNSDLYEKITEDRNDKRMPPPPRNRLTQEQIEVIAAWILQGADNRHCDRDTACMPENVSFVENVVPVIEKNCLGCHSGLLPMAGISLASYDGVRTVALSGRLYGAIARQPGYAPMPLNRGPLTPCEIMTIKAWIDDGALEN